MASTFQRMVDYFGAAPTGSALNLVSSGDGAVRTMAEASMTGPHAAYQRGPIMKNPVCRYSLVADATLSFTLGKAWPATFSNGAMTASGWTLVRIDVETRLGAFPEVVLTGVASEGVDAINKWTVSIPLVARARAQNLMGSAASIAGSLLSCSLAAGAEPVVLTEGLVPCASDVVHGAIDVTGVMLTPDGEASPLAASGWIGVGTPDARGAGQYRTYSYRMRKEL